MSTVDAEYKQQLLYLHKCVDEYTLPTLGKVLEGKLIEPKNRTKLPIKVYNKEEQKKKLAKLNKEEIGKLYTAQKQIERAQVEAILQASEIERQAELKYYNGWFPATKENYKHWAIQKTWSIAEGVLLILGKNPAKDIIEKLLYEVKATLRSPPQGLFGIKIPSMLIDRFEERYNTAKRYVNADDLPDPVSPLDFLKWAQERGYEIPHELLTALEEARHKRIDWQSQYEERTQQLNALIANNYDLKNVLKKVTEQCNHLISQNEALKKLVREQETDNSPKEQENTPNLRSEKTYLNTIAVLLEVIEGKTSHFSKTPEFVNRTQFIETLAHEYQGYPGLSKRTLHDKLNKAKLIEK